MLQIVQAIEALTIKMGQGKKGGKPMKVSPPALLDACL